MDKSIPAHMRSMEQQTMKQTKGLRIRVIEVHVSFQIRIPDYMFELDHNTCEYEGWQMNITRQSFSKKHLEEDPELKYFHNKRILHVWKTLYASGAKMTAWQFRDELRAVFKAYRGVN